MPIHATPVAILPAMTHAIRHVVEHAKTDAILDVLLALDAVGAVAHAATLVLALVIRHVVERAIPPAKIHVRERVKMGAVHPVIRLVEIPVLALVRTTVLLYVQSLLPMAVIMMSMFLISIIPELSKKSFFNRVNMSWNAGVLKVGIAHLPPMVVEEDTLLVL